MTTFIDTRLVIIWTSFNALLLSAGCGDTLTSGRTNFHGILPQARSLASLTTETFHPLSDLPVLSSFPGAPATLYLDFDGDFEASSFGYANVTTLAFDQDGDPTTFNDSEMNAINMVWKIVADDYAPFNINVSTLAPVSFSNGTGLHVVIGGDGSWFGGTGVGGVSGVGNFPGSGVNVSYVFSKNLGNGNWKFTGEAAAHESGHSFGLLHQGLYDGNARSLLAGSVQRQSALVAALG